MSWLVLANGQPVSQMHATRAQAIEDAEFRRFNVASHRERAEMKPLPDGYFAIAEVHVHPLPDETTPTLFEAAS